MADTHVTGLGVHLSPELLAAYLDGAITDAERTTIEAHLADCDDCRETVAESAVSLEDARVVEEPASGSAAASAGAERARSGKLLLLASRGRRVWPTFAALAAAAVIVFAVVIPRVMGPTDPNARPELASLVAAVGEHRPFEPRLTGGFKYGPLAPVMRSGEGTEPEAPPEVRIAAAELAQARESAASARTMAGQASGELVLGRVDSAMALLERVTREEPGLAAYWSDLSAAYLVRATRTGDAAAAQRGLAAADRALGLSPALPEALFNRALALEKLGRKGQAATAWSEATRSSPAGWAEEAARRAK